MNRAFLDEDERLREGISLLNGVASSQALTVAEKETIRELVADFSERIDNIKLRLGVIGEFNAGKSTLINAIIGSAVAATGDRPCTPVPISIEDAQTPSLIVTMTNGHEIREGIEEYERYTTDGLAPPNVKSVKVCVPSEFLRENRIALIDTPGINAINPEHTRISVDALSTMHAAILLMYSKQPGSKSTIEFLQKVSDQVDKLFVCVSKSDFLNEDQLNRVITELPRRLSDSSGVKIDRVWPIHIAVGQPGSDFLSFLSHLRNVMVREWYTILSRDVRSALHEYANKVSLIVNNRLALEERLFYSYLDLKPTSFPSIQEKIIKKIEPVISAEFEKITFEQKVKLKCAEVGDRVRHQIQVDFNPDEPILGFLPRKADATTIGKASTNVAHILSELDELRGSVRGKLESVAKSLMQESELELIQVNGSLDEMEKRLYRDTIESKDVQMEWRAVQVRRKKEKANCELLKAIYSRRIKISAASMSAGMAALIALGIWFEVPWLILGIVVSIFPVGFGVWLQATLKSLREQTQLHDQETTINDLVMKRIGEFKELRIPQFDLEGANAPTLEKLKSLDIGYKTNGDRVDRAIQIANIARLGGLGVAGAAVVAVKAIEYVRLPTARVAADEMLGATQVELDSFERNILESFSSLPVILKEMVDEYVQSIHGRYSSILEKVFGGNRDLLRSRELAIQELTDHSQRLSVYLSNPSS